MLTSGKGGRRRHSEIDALGLEEEEEHAGGQRSLRQRAAKKLAKNIYNVDMEDLEYVDSPASSAHSKDTGSTIGGGVKKDKRRTGRKKRKQRGRNPPSKEGEASKEDKGEPRVPPMKIKMIGRSGESDSPIFFAESVESWDEGSSNERGSSSKRKRKKKLPREESLESGHSSREREEDEEEEEVEAVRKK